MFSHNAATNDYTGVIDEHCDVATRFNGCGYIACVRHVELDGHDSWSGD
jgi:hypothetical protein